MSAIIAPTPTIHEWKKPFLIPRSSCAALTGPIGAASDNPKRNKQKMSSTLELFSQIFAFERKKLMSMTDWCLLISAPQSLDFNNK